MRWATAVLATVALLCCVSPSVPAKETGLNDQGFITTWLLLAAIPLEANQTGADGLDKEQVKDEAKLGPKAGDKIKVRDQELVWEKYKAKDYFIDFNDFVGTKTEDSVGYAVCYIHADVERKDIRLKVGSDDQARVYLNGKKVLEREGMSALVKDHSTAKVSLRKGVNVLVFKVINEKMDWSGCARFTDRGGRIIKNIKVSTNKDGEASAKKE